MNKYPLLLLLSIILPGLAQAAGNPDTGKHDDETQAVEKQVVEKQIADTQIDLNQAAQREYQQADLVLNQAYAQLMTALLPEQQQQLKVAQRAWLKFRDAEADFRAAPYQGGSIQPLIYSQTLLELTEQRSSQLKALYKEHTNL